MKRIPKTFVKIGVFRLFAFLSLFVFGSCAHLSMEDREREDEHPRQPFGQVQSIELLYARAIPGERADLYSVSYSYDFPHRDNVYIKGLGTVDAKGQHSYVTDDSYLEILESYNGRVIARLPYEDLTVVMGIDDLDELEPRDFPSSYRIGTWAYERKFIEHVFDVLNQHVSYYRIYDDQITNSIITSYEDVTITTDRKLYAQVAFMITHAKDSDPHDLKFKLQFIARERRRRTDWVKDVSDEVMDDVKPFVDQFFGNLERKL